MLSSLTNNGDSKQYNNLRLVKTESGLSSFIPSWFIEDVKLIGFSLSLLDYMLQTDATYSATDNTLGNGLIVNLYILSDWEMLV